MLQETGILIATAASIGFLHTLLGPDHYLPFILMSQARNWSAARTLWITAACGVGHVASSVVVGLVGVMLGISVNRLVDVESVRGGIAAWLLIGFGLAYMLWGIRKAIRNRPHSHPHMHTNGSRHHHVHVHDAEHAHLHEEASSGKLTPWVLFLIFVLGPCEPLIPLLMYPAAENSMMGVVAVAGVFSVVTVLTMTAVVWLGFTGFRFIPLGRLERFMHALAGGLIFLSGIGIRFLGL